MIIAWGQWIPPIALWETMSRAIGNTGEFLVGKWALTLMNIKVNAFGDGEPLGRLHVKRRKGLVACVPHLAAYWF